MDKHEYCDYCHKTLEAESYGTVDNLGRRGTFCSPDCREKWWKKIREQDYKNFVQWFKSQNIKQITLTADGKLKIEYNNNNKANEEISSQQTVNNQHKQQLTITKRHLQQTNEISLNQQKLNNLVNQPLTNEKSQDYKILWISLGGVGLLVIGGLTGWLLAKKKKRN